MPIAPQLVGNLDRRGYLDSSVDEELENTVFEHLDELRRAFGYRNCGWSQLRALGRELIPLALESDRSLAVPAVAFVYEPRTDRYRGPAGKPVRRRGAMHADRVTGGVLDRADPAACCPTAPARTVFRANTDPWQQRVAVYLAGPRARQSIRRRKVWVETIFGDAQVRRGLRRAQFRGCDRMRIQAWLTASAHNDRKLALRRKPGPETGAAALENGREQGERRLFSVRLLRLALRRDHTSLPWLLPN
jgi:hypothetical protein